MPSTGVNSGRIYVSEVEEGLFKVRADNGHLADFTVSNFEVLSTSDRESNLYVSSSSLLKFEEVSGGINSTLDTLYVQKAAEAVFIWDEEGEWYFGILGSPEITKISNFEWLDISADIIYTENKELFSTQFSGRTLYGVDTIQFYSNTSDLRSIDGLSREAVTGGDLDSDGVTDTADAFPLISLGGRSDIDQDGYPDSCDSSCEETGMSADADDDNDGVLDEIDAFPLDAIESVDTDGDGLGDNGDIDDDNDGFTDAEELADGTDPLSRFSCRSGCFSFDVDESLQAEPLTDGLLVIRHLFGFSGDSLTSGAVSSRAGRELRRDCKLPDRC